VTLFLQQENSCVVKLIDAEAGSWPAVELAFAL
jgi:hypothetical protein